LGSSPARCELSDYSNPQWNFIYSPFVIAFKKMTMNKILTLSIIVLIFNACAPVATTTPILSKTPAPTLAPTYIASQTSVSPSNIKVKKVYIVDKYAIEIPEDFTVHENLSSTTTTVPIYRIETSNGASFDIAVQPYTVSSSLIPGRCVVSTDFDSGTTSAPIFCEGLALTNLFTIPENRTIKYGSVISDLSLLLCTANSPCPVEIPPETRYSTTYVFVFADKSLDTILEFYVGDAFRGPSNEINDFEGLGAVLHNSIIPSLSIINP
jgi:hypothetical protein